MKRVVIFGAGDEGRRSWEALVQCGSVEIAGFVDCDERRHGRSFLGTTVHAPDWLDHATWDIVAVASARPSDALQYLERAGIASHRIVVCPVDRDDSALASVVARWFPDRVASVLANLPARAAVRVGIFGTGAAAMKVWEAISEIDYVDPVWFADNNPAQQGRALLWLDVIAPADIASNTFDAVVVGSMSRDAISQQLSTLGVSRQQILTPDVAGSVEQVQEQLSAMFVRLMAVTGRLKAAPTDTEQGRLKGAPTGAARRTGAEVVR